MDENNSFLKNYKKKAAEEPAPSPAQEPARETPKETQGPPSLRYEEKSGFVPPARGRAEQPPPGRRKPRLLLPITVGAVVVAGIILALVLLLNQGIEVIDFTNWTLNDAQLWAQENGVRLQVEEQFNDQYDKSRIFAQNPAKGEKAQKGSFVKLTVSKGHDPEFALELPDLMSMTKAEIDQWAEANFMEKVRVTAEFSDTVEAGRVISFTVNDSTVVDEVKRNSPIYVIVSKGRDESVLLVTVPNFREKTLADSMTFATENGILLKIVDQYDDYAPKGSIMAQSIKADEKIKKGEEITLTVSKGKKITMPDFSSFTKAKATAVTGELGIAVTFIDKYSSAATGKFISQSITAGTVYNDGDVLELYYSLGNKIIVASYVGQTQDAIEAWAKELNDQGADIHIAVTYTQSNQPKGRIIKQDKANKSIGISTTIKITVSKGKAVFMPDFVAPAGSGYDEAMTREKALALCEQYNIIPVFVAAKKSDRLPGEIWYQDIAAGKEVTEETTVTLKYNPANVTYAVPNFKGMTKSQILTAGYMKKFTITFVTADEPVSGYYGKVYQQSVAVNTTVAAGYAITVTISPNPPPDPTEEPTPEPTPT